MLNNFWSKELLAQSVKKTLPAEWGKIIGAGISSVSNDPAAGNGAFPALKCICIRTTTGAFAVPFAPANIVPTEAQILAAYFAKTSEHTSLTVNERFNGAYYTSNKNKQSYPVRTWCPAISKDVSGNVAWYVIKDGADTAVRHIPLAYLTTGWETHDGRKSTIVDGYTFSVSGGVLTIKYNGETVMKLR